MNFSCPWQLPPAKIRLSENEVHVWLAGLDALGPPVQHFERIISIDERRKADRFVFERDKERFIVSRGILRTILGKHYLAVKPQYLVFSYGVHGKPYLSEALGYSTIRFNQAGSNGLALYAFSKNRDVGIDLEYMRDLADAQQIVNGSFSECEKEAYNALPEREKPEAFFKCWTRKEAFIKAVGKGLYFPLDQFDVSFSIDEPAKIISIKGNSDEASGWTLVDIKPQQGFSAALAFKGLSADIKFWKFSQIL